MCERPAARSISASTPGSNRPGDTRSTVQVRRSTSMAPSARSRRLRGRLGGGSVRGAEPAGELLQPGRGIVERGIARQIVERDQQHPLVGFAQFAGDRFDQSRRLAVARFRPDQIGRAGRRHLQGEAVRIPARITVEDQERERPIDMRAAAARQRPAIRLAGDPDRSREAGSLARSARHRATRGPSRRHER